MSIPPGSSIEDLKEVWKEQGQEAAQRKVEAQVRLQKEQHDFRNGLRGTYSPRASRERSRALRGRVPNPFESR